MNNDLAAGIVLSYTYDAGTSPGKTRTATFRNLEQNQHPGCCGSHCCHLMVLPLV